MFGNINAQLAHRLSSFRPHRAGFSARAFHLKTLACIVPQQTFRHLTASGISGAENQHPLLIARGLAFLSCAWGTTTAAASFGSDGTNQRNRSVAAKAPASCARMKPGASTGRIPAKVLLAQRASVTAGFAKEVDAVNQYAPVI